VIYSKQPDKSFSTKDGYTAIKNVILTAVYVLEIEKVKGQVIIDITNATGK